jgi:hypothetical protein
MILLIWKLLLIPCNHCSYQEKSKNKVLSHLVNVHTEKTTRPDTTLLDLITKETKDKENEQEMK